MLKLLATDKCFLETDNSQFTLDEVYDKASEILNIDKNNLIERQKNNFGNYKVFFLSFNFCRC